MNALCKSVSGFVWPGGLLQLRGALLARRDRRLALVLALLALAARVLHDLSQNSLALLHLHVEEE